MNKKNLISKIRLMREEMHKNARPSLAMQQFEESIEETARNRRYTDSPWYKQNLAFSELGDNVVGAEYP